MDSSDAKEKPTIIFSLWALSLLAILVVGISVFIWREDVFGNRNATVRYPTYTLGRVIDRNLDLDEALKHTPKSRQQFYRLFLGSQSSFQVYAIDAYRDLLRYYRSAFPSVDLTEADVARARLVVLLAELDRLDETRGEIFRLSQTKKGRSLARLLAAAYFQGAQPPASETREAFDLIKPGWTADKIRARLAANGGNTLLVDQIKIQILARGESLERWMLLFLLVEVGIVIAAIVFVSTGGLKPLLQPRPASSRWQITLGVFIWSAFARQGLLLLGYVLNLDGAAVSYVLLDFLALLIMFRLIHRYLLVVCL